ncbi:hypothetical protein ACFP3P_21630 [Pelomonas aquatica]|uniref:Uncharacterized protein n=1 Tax=Pelomonas aquatica TaxID=431058 RepID=A0A9X4R3P8_9BURK|nr:hypothetical protein [Pelomonas aquatica]MCY4755444.1 hypothetical protein [Pelomonas aquatica]MDG0861690.1 hypothetical protein [Pelomonas aquatica]
MKPPSKSRGFQRCLHMRKQRDVEGQQCELPVLIERQQWKLWLAGVMLAVGGAGLLMPDGIGRTLDAPGVAVQFGAMVLCFVSLGWAANAVRCKHCGLRIVMFAISCQSVGQWLHWLLTVKRCPKCGSDHARRQP